MHCKRIVVMVCVSILLTLPLCRGYEVSESTLCLTLSSTPNSPVKILKIRVLTEDMIQVLGLPHEGMKDPLSLIVNSQSLTPVDFKVTEDVDGIHLNTRKLHLLIDPASGQVTFKDSWNKSILAEASRQLTPAVVCQENVYHARQSFKWQPDEALYGLGQHQEGHYNWRGHYVELFQYNKRAIVPFLLSTRGYGLLWDNPSYTKFDNSGSQAYLWSEVSDAVNYTFIYGPSADAVIKNYRLLTGAAPLFPKWAYGYIQSKERYNSQEELLEVAQEYRERHIPMDALVQDWRYWDDGHWGQKSFNVERFPDPSAMMQALHDQYHTHLMISVWPKMSIKTPNYQAMAAQPGFLYSPGSKNSFYDAFNPAARDLYWQQANEGLFTHGIDAWWCDATEPEVDDWDFNIDGYKRKMKPMIGSGGRYMNAYSLMHAKGIYENQRATSESKRVVNLTRSAFAGQQKYATITWSGDIVGTWDVFRAQIPAGLNFCMSGLPYWTTDIGGFFVQSKEAGSLGRGKWFRDGDYDEGLADDNYKELYVRWFQYGAFCPMFRTHGTDIPREIWQFGQPGDWAYDALVKFDRLRYRLMPYIYSQAWQITHNGYTLMRGLAMDFPHDSHVFGIEDQFMFGPAIMVSPVTEPKKDYRVVYLPQGTDWFNFWTGKRYTGGQTLQVPAPINQIPLFVKAGSIIPMGPAIQYATEACDPIELRIYPGADGQFLLYEDEGDTYGYEQGRYATIACQWNDREQTLTIEASQGEFPGRLTERQFHPTLVKGNDDSDSILHYRGQRLEYSFQ